MPKYSDCCHADLIVEESIEYFHGCDDGYELTIPFVLCSKCRKIQFLPVNMKA